MSSDNEEDSPELAAVRKRSGLAGLMAWSAQAPVRNRRASQLVGSGSLVGLSAEDLRNLKEAAGRRGYAVPRFNPQTGRMFTAQWRSWKKLQRKRLANIGPSGEAEELVITPSGRMALKQPNVVVSHTGALPDSKISNQVPSPGVGL